MHAIATQYTFLWVRKKELFLFSFIWIFLKLKKKKIAKMHTFSILITTISFLFLIQKGTKEKVELTIIWNYVYNPFKLNWRSYETTCIIPLSWNIMNRISRFLKKLKVEKVFTRWFTLDILSPKPPHLQA